MSYRADTDGLDHINVACVGRTMLGLMLNLSAYTPIVHPLFGNFVSLAGLWGWLVTARQRDVFRHLYGDQAFRTIANYPVVFDPQLHELIGQAIELKLQQNLTLAELFSRNKALPYVSYGDWKWNGQCSSLETWAYDDSCAIQKLTDLQAVRSVRAG